MRLQLYTLGLALLAAASASAQEPTVDDGAASLGEETPLPTPIVITSGATENDEVFFAQEPEFYAPDATIAFRDQPGYTDTNATQGLDFTSLQDRELLVGGVVVGFQVASAVAPLISGFIESRKKRCQQVGCFIQTSDRTCAISVAEQVQNEVTKGRDRYSFESIQETGAWVRYWRTQFEPIDRGDIATGNCTDGVTFAVTNCQSTGRVHC